LIWDSKDKMKGEIDKELINNFLSANSNNLDFAYLHIAVHRNNLIEDTLNALVKDMVNFRKPLKIKFIGEPGIDEGGL
jgi:hypothetical protein